jgi:hypothetical protein
MISIEENFSYIIRKASVITDEANRSLDDFERKTGRISPREEIFEMGMLMANLRRCRMIAEDLSERIPSPNKVPREYADSVAEVAAALFRFIGTCERREESIGKKALGYSCETAV